MNNKPNTTITASIVTILTLIIMKRKKKIIKKRAEINNNDDVLDRMIKNERLHLRGSSSSRFLMFRQWRYNERQFLGRL